MHTPSSPRSAACAAHYGAYAQDAAARCLRQDRGGAGRSCACWEQITHFGVDTDRSRVIQAAAQIGGDERFAGPNPITQREAGRSFSGIPTAEQVWLGRCRLPDRDDHVMTPLLCD